MDLLNFIGNVIGSSTSDLLERKVNFVLTDIIDTEEKTIIYCELPGVKKNDIDIKFCGTTFTISAEKKKPQIPETYNRLNSTFEIKYGRYHSSFSLPLEIKNRNSVSTNFENGILCIEINKSLESKEEINIPVS